MNGKVRGTLMAYDLVIAAFIQTHPSPQVLKAKLEELAAALPRASESNPDNEMLFAAEHMIQRYMDLIARG